MKKNANKLYQVLNRTIFVVFILFLSINSFSQSMIKGTITAADDHSPLIAATVVLKSTTIGTTTDYNGEYILVLKPGINTVKISYMGYETKEIEVSLKKNEVQELDIELNTLTITGEEIVVTAQAKGQLAAVNQQVNANQIVNVVSSERIKDFPDDNAAQSISRLPGIHLDGSKVVIRGIEPKMNKILINGVEMPSTDANNRSVSLGMISSNMLSGIEVFKSVTPDMDADAIGGVVNLRLQEAPEGLHYSTTIIGEYNSQEEDGDFKFWLDASNRFLNNKLGISLSFNNSINNGGADEISSSYIPLTEDREEYMFNEVNVIDKNSTSKSIGGNLILDYKLPNGKIILNSMISNGGAENINHRDRLSATNKSREIYLDHNKYTTLLFNNSLQYDQQFGKLKIDAFLSRISYKKETDFQYQYRFAGSSANFYSDSLTNSKRLTMEPYEMYAYEIPDAWESLIMKTFLWSPDNFNEHKTTATINLQYSINLFENVAIKLKTGAKHVSMDREYDNTVLRYGDDIGATPIHADMQDWLVSIGHTDWAAQLPFSLMRDYSYKTNNNFMNGSDYYGMPYVVNSDYTKKMAVDLMDHSKLQETESVHKNDYWGGERLYAGYFMAEINLWNRLIVIPGFRYENLTNDYSALKVSTIAKNIYNVEDTLNVPVTHKNFFPHLHIKLKTTDWMDIRFSYNKTLSRPDYNYAIPNVFYNTVASSGEAGNPFLKPALSENIDLNFTVHQKNIGLFTVGFFRKNIDNIFYPQQTLIKNLPDSSIINQFPLEKYSALENGETDFYINNTNRAYLKGVEIEWQSNLSFLPKPFNGLVFNANYTKVWSQTDYPLHRVKKEFLMTPPWIMDVEDDTLFTNRLIDQANDIANISLGYDYKRFSARLSFRFQGNVISGISNYETENGYTNDDYKFDLALKQTLPFKFARIDLFFNAINFTDVPYKRYSIYPQRGKTNTLTRYSGRRFQVGLRVKI